MNIRARKPKGRNIMQNEDIQLTRTLFSKQKGQGNFRAKFGAHSVRRSDGEGSGSGRVNIRLNFLGGGFVALRFHG